MRSKTTMTEIIQKTPYSPPDTAIVTTEQKNCTTCNALIHRKAEICPKCGVRQRRPASKSTLLLLTFFLGGLGAHRFYLGNYILGTIYLLFFWTAIPGLIAFVEFLVFLLTSSDSIEDNYTAHGSAVAFAFIPIFFVFIIGIFAAIAIPAYTDYLKKGKVSEAIQLLGGLKTPAEEYMASKGEFPPTIDVLSDKTSGKYTASLESNPEEFYFEATMSKEDSILGGKILRLIYHPDSKRWSCSAAYPNGIPQKFLPSICRE
jgi:TM2 domain-containing membrane protein YozV/type II secretory pathway pseudopilin PulG